MKHRNRSDRGAFATRLAIVGACALLCALLVGAAVALAEESSSPAPGKVVLRIGTTQDVDNLNPFVGYSTAAYEVYHLNYDFLVGYSAEDTSPRPELATSWEVSDDGLEWTFELRKGVTWQDGEPFTADDVAFTYTYNIENELSAYGQYVNNITKVTAVDEDTVKFEFAKPKANMLRCAVPIVPEHIWSKVPGEKAGNDYQNTPPIIGTGPFQVVEAKKAEYIRLVANRDYWGGAPKVDEVIIEVYQNQDTMTMDLKSGAIDVAYGVPVAQFNALKNEPGIQADAATQKYFTQITMNVYDDPASLGNPVLKDVKFRRAISWAVDKEKMVATCWGGYAQVGDSILTPTVDYYWTPPEEIRFGYDLEKAKTLLDEAGYTDGDGDGIREGKKGKPIKLRLWTRSESPEQQRAGKLFAGSLQEIGIDVELTVMNDGTISDGLYNYKGDTYAPDFDLYIWGWGEYADPDYILGVMTTGQIEMWNDSCYSDPRYDELYEQQAAEMDPEKRAEQIQQLQQLFYEAAPYSVLCYPNALIAYNTGKWEGWVRYPSDNGMVVMSNDNIDSYLKVAPKTAETATSESSSSTPIIIVVVVAVVVVIIVAAVVAGRRRGRKMEE